MSTCQPILSVSLLQFLQGEVQWQVNSLETLPENIDPTTESLKRYLPKLIKQWLVTEHPALPFHRSLFETEVEDDTFEQEKQTNVSVNESQSTADAQNNNAVTVSDELDTLLNKAMRKTKLAQKKQFPPAPLWQAVFDTLNGRMTSKHTQLVGLPNKAQYEAIATMLGQGLGKLGKIDEQTLSVLADMLALEGALDVNDATKVSAPIVFDSVFNIGEIDIEGGLVYQVRHPAKAFLRTQKVYVVQGEEAMAHQEPLFLDNLTTYQIKEHLIQSLVADATALSDGNTAIENINATMMYQKMIPAGVARQTTIPNQKQKLQQQCAEFREQLMDNGFDDIDMGSGYREGLESNGLQMLTPTIEKPIEVRDVATVLNASHHQADSDSDRQVKTEAWRKLLPASIKIKGSVPVLVSPDTHNINAHNQSSLSYAEQSPKQWLNILPNSASPRHLLKFWLSHLYWQVARRTTNEQVALNDGVSIWRFNKASSQVDTYKNAMTFKLSPIVYEDAVIELIKWAIFGNLSGQVPITLLPEYALSYLGKCSKAEENESTTERYWPKRADFSDWLRLSYHSDTIYDTCSQHAIWQYVLRDQDTFQALSGALTTLAQPLYQPMFAALSGLDN